MHIEAIVSNHDSLFVFFVLIILFAKVASVANISLNSWQIVVNFALQSLKIVLSVLNKNVLFVQQECIIKLLQVVVYALKDSLFQVYAPSLKGCGCAPGRVLVSGTCTPCDNLLCKECDPASLATCF